MRCLIVALLALAACGKSNQATGVEDIKKAFSKEGWKTDSLVTQDPSRFSGQKCLAGPMEGLDLVICEYGSIDAVQQGKAATEAWVGQAVTGVALDNGRTVLGIADRGRADPNGKLVHKISTAYRALKP